jgi:N-acetylglucosamine-6-sulfatase
MRRWIWSFAMVVGLLAALPATAVSQAAQPQPQPQGGGRRAGAPSGPPAPATVPAPRDDGRHRTFVEIARGAEIDLLFVGDSITDSWRLVGQPVWDQHFAPLKAANFGISGDTTQGVLWRMQNGELEGFKARLIVLMLGTNNIPRGNPPEEIAEGLRLIVQEFRSRQPQAKVLLLGIFPRSADPTHQHRAAITDINGRIAKFADHKNVFFMDIGKQFLAPDGTLPADIMPDGLHPNLRGYRIWADAIAGRVRELMK